MPNSKNTDKKKNEWKPEQRRRSVIHTMKQAILRIVFLFGFLVSAACLQAGTLPNLPEADRILTMEEVKNYWINHLRQSPVPPKPNGLHPEDQRAWQADIETRKSLIQSIRNGDYDIHAKLAQLHQNANFWKTRKNDSDAEAAEGKIRELQEYLARLETLETLRKAAQSQIDAADRLKTIEAEISAIRRSCSEHDSSH